MCWGRGRDLTSSRLGRLPRARYSPCPGLKLNDLAAIPRSLSSVMCSTSNALVMHVAGLESARSTRQSARIVRVTVDDPVEFPSVLATMEDGVAPATLAVPLVRPGTARALRRTLGPLAREPIRPISAFSHSRFVKSTRRSGGAPPSASMLSSRIKQQCSSDPSSPLSPLARPSDPLLDETCWPRKRSACHPAGAPARAPLQLGSRRTLRAMAAAGARRPPGWS